MLERRKEETEAEGLNYNQQCILVHVGTPGSTDLGRFIPKISLQNREKQQNLSVLVDRCRGD